MWFHVLFKQMYMSPELVLCRGHNTKTDIYSLGTTIIHMQTASPPWVRRYPRTAYPSYLYIVSTLAYFICFSHFCHVITDKHKVSLKQKGLEKVHSTVARGFARSKHIWSRNPYIHWGDCDSVGRGVILQSEGCRVDSSFLLVKLTPSFICESKWVNITVL